MADKIVRMIKQAIKVIDGLKHLALRLFLLAELIRILLEMYQHHQPMA